MGRMRYWTTPELHPSTSEVVNPAGTGSGAEGAAIAEPGLWQDEPNPMKEERISLAADFSPYPGGADSAREFLATVLLPRLQAHQQVVIDLDGVAALPASFLKYVFHALVEEHGVKPDEVGDRISLETTDPELEIYRSIADRYAREEALATAA